MKRPKRQMITYQAHWGLNCTLDASLKALALDGNRWLREHRETTDLTNWASTHTLRRTKQHERLVFT